MLVLHSPGMSLETYLVDIHPDDCSVLLAASTLGRLGAMVGGRPEVFSVNYVYDRESGCVVFPATVGTKLYAALSWPWVAFEIDEIEDDGSGAWSVMVVGRAEVITDAAEIVRLASARHVLWAAGRTMGWIRIVPSEVTGRRIGTPLR
jgi:uncharacterized protein